MCVGVGSGGRFRKVPEGCCVCWCRQVPEGSGDFRAYAQQPARGPTKGEGEGVRWLLLWWL